MPISFDRSVFAGTNQLLPVLLLSLLSLPASQAIGQDAAAPPTAVQKQFNRIDLFLGAAGSLTSKVSGIEKRDASTTQTDLTIGASSTAGELFTLRYVAKPLLGFEFNFGNARLTQNYNFNPPPGQVLLLSSAQTGVHELTLGYVAHLRYRPLGVQPYLGAGGGTMRFKPTPGGGEGLPEQYRAAYYYNFGVEDGFASDHFGVRLGFRQRIYLAPDFLQNYLTITRRVRTSEPTFGFYLPLLTKAVGPADRRREPQLQPLRRHPHLNRLQRLGNPVAPASWLAACVPSTPSTRQPAANPASTPDGASSTTTQSAGANPSSSAPRR